MNIEDPFARFGEIQDKYKYFNDVRERFDIFTFIEGLSKYVHDNKVKNVVFVDTSARPAWVGFDEYWKKAIRKKRSQEYFL